MQCLAGSKNHLLEWNKDLVTQFRLDTEKGEKQLPEIWYLMSQTFKEMQVSITE